MKRLPENKLRALVVDDHALVREGIRTCLPSEGPIEIVGEASNGIDAIAKAKELAPDIVLLDISLPDMDGLQVTKRLQEEVPDTAVIILTVHDKKEYVISVLRSGARGYVLKDTSPAELAAAVQAVGRGEAFFSPGVSKFLVDELKAPVEKKDSDIPALSRREHEVIAHIAQGLSNKEIAAQMNLSVRTVGTYRERIMRKLDIHNAAGLTRYALKKGIAC